MTVDRRSFLARFPEFEPASKAMIESALLDAVESTDTAVFNAKTDEAVRYQTAHLLAISPFGQQARLISKDGETTYSKQLMKLTRSVTPGFRVA